jgi:hypothetical protein
MFATARETMDSVVYHLVLAELVSGEEIPRGPVRSVTATDDGSDVAVFGLGDLDGPAVLVGTVNPDGSDTILKLTPTEAHELAGALHDAADDSEGLNA